MKIIVQRASMKRAGRAGCCAKRVRVFVAGSNTSMVWQSRCEIFRGPSELAEALWRQLTKDGQYISESPADQEVSKAIDDMIAAGGAEWGGRFGTDGREWQMPWGPAFCDSDAVWEEVQRCLLQSSEHSMKDEAEGFEWVYVKDPGQYVGKLRSRPPLKESEYFRPGGTGDAQDIREDGGEDVDAYLADPAREKEAGALQAMLSEAADAGQAILVCHEVM